MKALLQADVFSVLTGWDSIEYFGATTPKLLRFDLKKDESSRQLFLASIISREEKLTLQAFLDLLGHAVDLAQTSMHGFFGLDILTADIANGMRNFNASDYSRLLINHSKELSADQPSVLVHYGQIFAQFKKRAPADWGKIDLMTHFEIINAEKTRRLSYLKKMVRESGAENALYVVHDLSHSGIWSSEEPKISLPNEIYLRKSSQD